MATGGQIGSGVKIAYAISSPHTWVTIPQILGEPTVPTITRDRVETTVHGVTSLRTYIPGLAEVQDLVMELEADLDVGGVHLALQQYERSQTTLWWRVEIPRIADLATTNYMAFQLQGRVSQWLLHSPIDGLKTIEVTVQFESNYMVQQPMATQIT